MKKKISVVSFIIISLLITAFMTLSVSAQRKQKHRTIRKKPAIIKPTTAQTIKLPKPYKGGVFNERNLKNFNHVVLLVGWDDEKGAWLVKNSWGEESARRVSSG